MLLYYQPDIIKKFFRDGSDFGVKITYVTPLQDMGTAGAVKAAEKYLDERFMVISGDLLTDFNLKKSSTSTMQTGPWPPSPLLGQGSVAVWCGHYGQGKTDYPVSGEAGLGRGDLRHHQYRHLSAGTGDIQLYPGWGKF